MGGSRIEQWSIIYPFASTYARSSLAPGRSNAIRPQNPDYWHVVNYEEFDGKYINALDGTSLHLGFSGYEQPLFAGEHGNHRVDVLFIEAMVSLHDRGEWIADLDILAADKSSLATKMTADSSCPMAANFSKPDFLSQGNGHLGQGAGSSFIRSYDKSLWQLIGASGCHGLKYQTGAMGHSV